MVTAVTELVTSVSKHGCLSNEVYRSMVAEPVEAWLAWNNGHDGERKSKIFGLYKGVQRTYI